MQRSDRLSSALEQPMQRSDHPSGASERPSQHSKRWSGPMVGRKIQMSEDIRGIVDTGLGTFGRECEHSGVCTTLIPMQVQVVRICRQLQGKEDCSFDAYSCVRDTGY